MGEGMIHLVLFKPAENFDAMHGGSSLDFSPGVLII